jgi:hypothetical protein
MIAERTLRRRQLTDEDQAGRADRIAASFKPFVATVALCGDCLVCGLTMRSLSERVLPGHL